MGVFSAIGKGADSAVRGTINVGTQQAKTHPKMASAVGGAAAGSYYTNYRHTHPEFYDSTPNKGRAMNKHPYYGGGYNG